MNLLPCFFELLLEIWGQMILKFTFVKFLSERSNGWDVFLIEKFIDHFIFLSEFLFKDLELSSKKLVLIFIRIGLNFQL